MTYDISNSSILLMENNKKKFINLDATFKPFEQDLLKMILMENKSFTEICDFVDSKINALVKAADVQELKMVQVDDLLDETLLTGSDDESEIINSDKLEELIEFSSGQLTIKDNTLYWRGEPIYNKKMIEFISHYQSNGADIEFIERFLDKVYQNPDAKVRNDIFDFIVNRCGILSDGDFLAYKRVRTSYMDIHSNTMDNSIGKTVFMDRAKCNPNPNQTCSSGLHVCTKGYLGSFIGDRTVLCKVNPKDVVAVPNDYSAMKMRTCYYKVVGEIKNNNEFSDILAKLYIDPTSGDKLFMEEAEVNDNIEVGIQAAEATGVTVVEATSDAEANTEATVETTPVTPAVKVMDLEVTTPEETLLLIFGNDSKVLSSLNVAKKAYVDHKDLNFYNTELINRATKIRPKNAKLLYAISVWDNRASKAEQLEEVLKNNVSVTDDAETIKEVIELFSTDTKVAKALEKITTPESDKTLFETIVDRIKHLRPTSAKLNKFLENLKK